MSDINLTIYQDAGFSWKELKALQELLEKNPSIHWIKLNPKTGIYELTLNNSLMSCFRGCPSLFISTWVEGYAGNGRSWILEYGTLFHKMIEVYYQDFRKPSFNIAQWAVQLGSELWTNSGMDAFSHVKEFTTSGGRIGFCTLLGAYAGRFGADNERLRVIGTEIAFGSNKEVPLGYLSFQNDSNYRGINYPYSWLQVYLSGRIDVLCDDRTSIFPLDHKTKGTLRNDPSKFYEIDEGPTGYVFAVNAILPAIVHSLGLEDILLHRECNKIMMNYVSKAPTPDPNDRFRRLPIMKTADQLESYRLRMLNTAEDIFRALVRYASTGEAVRNTGMCTNHYGSDCFMLPVHRQSSREHELIVLNTNFHKSPIWNTESVEKTKGAL